MDELLAERGFADAAAARAGGATEALHRLVADWQLLADLSFADLLLLVPDASPEQFVVVAQMRPTTGPTVYQDDLVGSVLTAAERPQLAVAIAEGRICREGDPVWFGDAPIRQEALPVRVDGAVVAIVTRDTNVAAARTPSQLEIAYLRSANDLAQMLAEGRWPYPGETGVEWSGPRVGDGLIQLDAEGIVAFASPNALSAYRRLGHRGDLAGQSLSDVTVALADSGPAQLLAHVATGQVPAGADIEAHDAVVQLRALPLRPGGQHIGALVLVHDVTELRRQERALVGKDATIREIHHRVKNNLQTVAALLRLQARRLAAPEARTALEESVRRVSSIAVVHETLSGVLDESVRFDDIADQVMAMVAEVAGAHVVVRRVGSFGVLTAEVATPLAMVLSELVQNAVEHAYGEGGSGEVDVRVSYADEGALLVEVVDSGRGLPPGFSIDGSDRLGLAIARTLVESELGGRLTLTAGDAGGTVARVEISGAL
ncbi:MAG TPA: histidine kinase N-terminal domain-containing protein [Mycobacteriales bacterium]|nr:histidine kinase N-terminal domain-containing protein [Mycobacteriales bacterium]